ncbi:mucoidy inhibitor MuiA family protein [Ichthyenterobacterium magnum]|uniref:Uncharacterized protein (TIGR02231 family) n=1 Tax=Ichthyenterobacterium magnum TaxID=1230530 RepID=A0A420DMH0_9FLAO|nr:mucoidy inhibitor MuiA family protein [Ichthyenterobacterium magnum]RKE95411.1 uncharacterized protein (TIGR02231 family) [Ichthyenterobacterium magnum]
MKYLILALSLFTIQNFASGKETVSNINDVTVYLSGAQITRTANIKLPIGTTEFLFNELSPNIQESSIQIAGLKNATILSINYGVNYLSNKSKSAEIELLEGNIKTLYDDIQFEDDLISGYNEELSLIQTNRKLGNDNQVVSLEKLQQFARYYRTRSTEIKSLIYKSTKKKREHNAEIAKIQLQLNELNADHKTQTGEIKVKLNTSIPTSLNLKLTYNVTNAGWFPIYDLKAEKINTPIALDYKAHVYQNTGSNWDNVKLVLSTNDPNTNNIKPEVNPKYLNFISRYSNYNRNRATRRYNYKYNPLVQTVSGTVLDETGIPLPGVNVIIKGTTNGTQTDFDGKYSLKINRGQELSYTYVGMVSETLPIHSSLMNITMQEDASQLDEVIVTAYAVRGSSSRIKEDKIETIEPEVVVEQEIINTRFEIKKAYTIPSDGDVTVIEIDKFLVPATYNYFTAPVINENVFLTAKIGNWEQYNLLPAEANIYFEGSYSGKTMINPQATTDSLTVSLGIDPNVIVKRTQPNNFKKNAFIGNNKIINKAYEIEIKNNKQSAIDLVLVDRIPISQNKSIKIDNVETGTSNYDNKKGLMTWKVKLNSNDSKTYKFSYTVKYPKYKRVNL